MNRWSENEIKELAAKGKIKSYKSFKNTSQHKKKSKEKTWLSTALNIWAENNKYQLTQEYKFHPSRKWRFDWAFQNLKIAVEYEGIFSAKSRHTSITGFIGDIEKYNAATILGWKVIRLTAKNYKEVTTLLDELTIIFPQK